jgi:uncharacterized membrane protein
MKRSLVYHISLQAMFIALYFVLAKITLSFGNLHLTLASLPLLVSALLLGFGDTVAVAFLGEFLMFSYGISLTTPLWLLGPVVRALLLGSVAAFYRKKGLELDHQIIPYYLTVVVSALIVTVINTGVLFLDALIVGYPFSFVWLETLLRLLTGLVTAVVVALLAHPLSDALRKLSPSLSPAKPH